MSVLHPGETYGKLYLLWDPTTTDQPGGQPSLSLFHQMDHHATPTS